MGVAQATLPQALKLAATPGLRLETAAQGMARHRRAALRTSAAESVEGSLLEPGARALSQRHGGASLSCCSLSRGSGFAAPPLRSCLRS
mmetsp:Transcript_47313/g.120739  ORF Transcript_47313/g.120739 Transcript_47313/m.120739 type:complete len:89 (+) Transcript_47313:207-473(+)